jgi:hypothetical protein
MTVIEGIAILAQLVTLAGVIGGVLISFNNSRMLAQKANKSDVDEVHKLVNGKTAKLEKMIEDKAFKAGVAKGKATEMKNG